MDGMLNMLTLALCSMRSYTILPWRLPADMQLRFAAAADRSKPRRVGFDQCAARCLDVPLWCLKTAARLSDLQGYKRGKQHFARKRLHVEQSTHSMCIALCSPGALLT